MEVVCYADDTLVLAEGSSSREASERTTRTVENEIETLGLKIAAEKTEAIIFPPKSGTQQNTEITIQDTPIKVGNKIKYLGLVIDKKWSFIEHTAASTAARAEKVALVLRGIMPNLRSPSQKKTNAIRGHDKLYSSLRNANMVQSYGKEQESDSILQKSTKKMAIRTICGYRTISHEAAGLLAGQIPIDIMAWKQREFFWWIREKTKEGTTITGKEIEDQRNKLNKKQ